MLWKRLAVLLLIHLCSVAEAKIRGAVKVADAGVDQSPTANDENVIHVDIPDQIIQDESTLNEEESREESESERMLQSSALLKILNDCGYGVTIGVKYSTSSGSTLKWTYIRGGGRLRLPGVTDPTFYIYGRDDSNNVVWSGNSNLCISGSNTCFRQVSLGSIDSGSVNYRPCSQTAQLSAGASWTDASDQVVAPPPPPPPAPAPAPAPAPSDVASAWLNAHNSRRSTFFKQHNKDPKDLKWSQSLAQSAQSYAELLLTLNGCTIMHGYQGNSYGGENLACDWGGNVGRTPEEVLTAWFENEQNLPFNQKLHFSQVAWRGTSYVGCGQASKTLSDGSLCSIQSCRYVAPGNCNVDDSNLLSQMLQEFSPCTPPCPNEGCV